jgi:tetratricopeptide (TPR) repeat protein
MSRSVLQFRSGFTRGLTVAALIAGSAIAAPAFGAGDSGSGSSTTKSCPRGEVYDSKTGQCVKQSGGNVTDETLYAYGSWLAQSGRYGQAIEVLSQVENKDDPRVLNYLGYANRQLGRYEVGLGYYRQALLADPDYVKAREYLGEAYLVLNQPELARVQLGEIGTRCGIACEEYRLLAEAIGDYEAAFKRRS